MRTLLSAFFSLCLFCGYGQTIVALDEPDSSSNSGVFITALAIGTDQQPIAGLGNAIFQRTTADKWIHRPTRLVQLGQESVVHKIATNYTGVYAWVPQWRSQKLHQIAKWNGQVFEPLTGGPWQNADADFEELEVSQQGVVYSIGRVQLSSNNYKALFRYQNGGWDTLVTFRDSLSPRHLHLNKLNQLFISCKVSSNDRPDRIMRLNNNQFVLLANTGFASAGSIEAMCSDSSGNLIVAGTLEKANGETFVGRWNGTSWMALGSGTSDLAADDGIMTLACGKNGWIYAAGAFTSASTGNPCVARWNGTNWAPLGTGTNALAADAPIHVITVDTDNNVYAAGEFVNSKAAYYVARFNGTSWQQSGAAPAIRHYYRTSNQIEADANGTLYASVQRSDFHASQLIRFQPATGYKRMDSSENNGISLLHVDRLNQLFVAAFYGTSGMGVARWTGSGYAQLNQSSLNSQSNLAAITSGKSGILYASGDRPTASGTAGFVARWNGTAWVNVDNTAQPLNVQTAYEMAVDNSGNFSVFTDSLGYFKTKKWTGTQWQSLPSRRYFDGLLSHDTVRNTTSILGSDNSGSRLMSLADTGWKFVSGHYISYPGFSYGAFQRSRDTNNVVIAYNFFDLWSEDPNPDYHLERYNGNNWQLITSTYDGTGINGEIYDGCFDAQGNYYFVGSFTNARGFTYIGKLLAPSATVPLPKAILSGAITNHPQLSWRLQGDLNDLKEATLLRSTDGRDFSPVSAVTHQLQYTDKEAPAAAKLYYRLRLTSHNGENEYSNIVVLQTPVTPLSISISPNPAKDRIVLSSKETLSNATARLINAQGQVVQQWNGLNGQHIPLIINDASAGSYQLLIQSADSKQTIPLRIQ